ncbi:MAG: hypothetical protein LBD16_09340 [Oscillospiraceae bacterium]|nr:hypothetical protein [Oscillospiraceae bacterium]
MRDDQKHNEASALHSAELRGFERGKLEAAKEIAAKMIRRGATDIEIPGLTDYLTT